MPAAIYDITIEQGATFTLSLVWKDSAGTPIDLTGWQARMQVRPAYHSDVVFLSLSSPSGGITLGGTAGTIEVVGSAAATAAIDGRKAVYDIELVAPGGAVTRLLQGAAVISPEVTR
ncbi:hypothetical protein UFOVP121_42 [uncultured Caudovirales phage]|uniref:Uncharacterized protein n=1 Tax=uncultured Caudovirales phage TaxID=2100421 RepID=A0A6J5LCL5_9CAUD|nr:hypothetical protein UFOVP121_42 [uncultured Caudovirales phage]CAB4135002.1 hypothetical protein UFOVP277_47 [uncultured Caudovirales phage]